MDSSPGLGCAQPTHAEHDDHPQLAATGLGGPVHDAPAWAGGEILITRAACWSPPAEQVVRFAGLVEVHGSHVAAGEVTARERVPELWLQRQPPDEPARDPRQPRVQRRKLRLHLAGERRDHGAHAHLPSLVAEARRPGGHRR